MADNALVQLSCFATRVVQLQLRVQILQLIWPSKQEVLHGSACVRAQLMHPNIMPSDAAANTRFHKLVRTALSLATGGKPQVSIRSY